MTGQPRRPPSDRGQLRLATDAALAVAWAGFGLWAGGASNPPLSVAMIMIVALTAVAVGLFRRAPAVALVLVWLAGVIQVLSLTDLLAAQAGVLLVAYGAARYGGRLTVWLGGLSVLLGAGLGEYYVFGHPSALPSAVDVVAPLLQHTGLGVASVFLLGASITGVPWTVGIVVRLSARYQRSVAQQDLALARATAAEQTAQVRTEQAHLARDVHDLVGHSLAVIIAQADAAQLSAGAPDSPARQALENIAGVARSSLGEIRDVLTRTRDPADSTAPPSDLTVLVERARTAGNQLSESTQGIPTELPSDLQATLYRVVQEMLTNAIKHGRPGGRIGIAHTWAPTAYTVGVTNLIPHAPADAQTAGVAIDTAAGMGLTGIRARLRDIGGTLELRQHDDNGAQSFAATAHVPLGQHQARP